MPAVFHFFSKLRIVGSDWFAYIAEPNALPKIVEDQKNILALMKNSKKYDSRGIKALNFKKFAHAFSNLVDS